MKIFIPETLLCMMGFLILNIPIYLVNISLSIGKNAVASLPLKPVCCK